MAKVKKYSDNNGSMASAWSNSGDKRYGFVSKDRVPDQKLPDSRYTTRYGAGIDNLPLSGYNERSINTPLGTFDYGNDQDTAFAGFTPNFERTTGGQNYATINGLGDSAFRAGSWGIDPQTYFAGAFLGGDKNYIPNFDKTFNTPLGSLELYRNTEEPNSVFADYQPNNYYLQALANLLMGR